MLLGDVRPQLCVVFKALGGSELDKLNKSGRHRSVTQGIIVMMKQSIQKKMSSDD